MAREFSRVLGVSRSLLNRLGVPNASLESVYGGVVPTMSVGRDFFDRERPLWHAFGQAPITVGGSLISTDGFTTVSLTSEEVDLAIYSVDAHVTRLVDAQFSSFPGPNTTWIPRFMPQPNVRIGLLTPPASWVPFQFAGVIQLAGVKPRLTFDAGRAVLIGGYNVDKPPFAGSVRIQPGPWLFNLSVYGVAPSVHSLNAGNAGPVWRFDPPLILPAGMFLTVVNYEFHANLNFLEANFAYRELEGVR